MANALLVTKARVNAVVATLGIGTIVVGLTFGYSAGTPVIALPTEFTNITLGTFLGVPSPIMFMVLILVLLWVVLNRTPFGQRIQATGANRHAARLAGVRTDRVKMGAFIIAGLCAAVTGILLASLSAAARSARRRLPVERSPRFSSVRRPCATASSTSSARSWGC